MAKREKYEGRIDIVDRAGNLVATLLWLGDTYSGTGTWVNLQSDEITSAISDLMARNIDLSEVRYAEMVRDAATVAGWEGFSGHYQALNAVLPEIGLKINKRTVEWPIDPSVRAAISAVS